MLPNQVRSFLENRKTILATSSARRHQIFKKLQIPFDFKKPEVDEKEKKHEKLYQYSERMAFEKAVFVLNLLESSSKNLVIAADTIVSLDKKILKKPRDEREARETLLSLSDRTHEVITSVTFGSNKEKLVSFLETTEVSFTTFTEEAVSEYIRSSLPFDRAGGYGIQDQFGMIYIKSIKGDYHNVLGFPITSFLRNLHDHIISGF